jgi:Mrp family chromosome partitioning ATPase
VALSDPVVLATQVGGVLLVIESGGTNRNAAAQAVYHLAAAKANLLGVILNKVDLRREGYHTYYYHQQYYRSYFEDEAPETAGSLLRRRREAEQGGGNGADASHERAAAVAPRRAKKDQWGNGSDEA